MASVLDLHVHTNRGSADSSLTPEDLVAEAKRLDLTGVMITEHTGWDRPDFEAFARQQDLVLLLALEAYTPLGHIITIGLDKYVTGFSGGIDTIRTLRREVDKVGGFMILAHPFRFLFDNHGGAYTQNILYERVDQVPATPEEAINHPIFELVDEVEVVNGGNIEVENRFAQEVAALLGRWGTGGSDAHSTDGFARGVTVFHGDIRNERDLVEALRSGDFAPVEGFHVGAPINYGRTSWLKPWMLDGRGREDANR